MLDRMQVGDGIVAELQADGVDTALALRQASAPSPFTYIIVDSAGKRRGRLAAACASSHTPAAGTAGQGGSDTVYHPWRCVRSISIDSGGSLSSG